MLFIIPVNAIDESKINIIVNGYSAKIKDNKYEYYFLVDPDSKNVSIHALAEDGVEIKGTGLIEIKNQDTLIPVVFEKDGEKLEYNLHISKKLDGIDLNKISIMVDGKEIEISNNSATYNVFFQKYVNIEVTTNAENVEVLGTGKIEVKDNYTYVPITIKKGNNEKAYIITLRKTIKLCLIYIIPVLIILSIMPIIIANILDKIIKKVLKK